MYATLRVFATAHWQPCSAKAIRHSVLYPLLLTSTHALFYHPSLMARPSKRKQNSRMNITPSRSKGTIRAPLQSLDPNALPMHRAHHISNVLTPLQQSQERINLLQSFQARFGHQSTRPLGASQERIGILQAFRAQSHAHQVQGLLQEQGQHTRVSTRVSTIPNA